MKRRKLQKSNLVVGKIGWIVQVQCVDQTLVKGLLKVATKICKKESVNLIDLLLGTPLTRQILKDILIQAKSVAVI